MDRAAITSPEDLLLLLLLHLFQRSMWGASVGVGVSLWKTPLRCRFEDHAEALWGHTAPPQKLVNLFSCPSVFLLLIDRMKKTQCYLNYKEQSTLTQIEPVF